MRSNKEVKADLINALEAVGDVQLNMLGFKRRKGSLSYIRSLGDARQTIAFDADLFPKYQSDAEIHIHPAIHLSIKSVSDATLSLVGGDKMLLANAPDVILNQPIEFAAPKDKHVRWFASGFSEISQRVFEIVSFVEEWVIPLLDELVSSADLIELYESNDERVMKQRHWYLFIAGAEIAQGNLKKALAVLEANFRAPGLRKRYAAAFDFFEGP